MSENPGAGDKTCGNTRGRKPTTAVNHKWVYILREERGQYERIQTKAV